MMIRKNFLIVFVNLLLCCAVAGAEEPAKSDLQQRAEAVNVKENIAQARSLYIRAFEDYAAKGQMQQAVECGTKGAALYYKENFYKEAFDLLRRIDASINNAPNADKSALQYYTTKERLQMYMKLRKVANAQEQLAIMDREAAATKDERVKDDLLYTKAIYYYTFGMNEKGNAVFGEMTSKLTASKNASGRRALASESVERRGIVVMPRWFSLRASASVDAVISRSESKRMMTA